jgi:hypothetical protein
LTIEDYDLYLIGAIESLDARIVNHDPRDYDLLQNSAGGERYRWQAYWCEGSAPVGWKGHMALWFILAGRECGKTGKFQG